MYSISFPISIFPAFFIISPGVFLILEYTNLSQKHCNIIPKGRWIHCSIPDVKVWTIMKYGQVDFYIILTGHGCFRAHFRLYEYTYCPDCEEWVVVAEQWRTVVRVWESYNKLRRRRALQRSYCCVSQIGMRQVFSARP